MLRATNLLLLLLAATAAADADPPRRDARSVVFRGARSVAKALSVAAGDAFPAPDGPRPVAIVLDSTPFTAYAAGEIATAVLALEAEARGVRADWRLVRLGDSTHYRTRSAASVTERLGRFLAKDTEETSTIRALRRSVRDLPDRCVVVYVADAHFEDDEGLEDLITELRRDGKSLRVIGPEAGFGRPFGEIGEAAPLGPDDPARPRRTGDTAWPHLPLEFRSGGWHHLFPVSLPVRLGDRIRTFLGDERRGRAPPRDEFLRSLRALRGPESVLAYGPVPSGFGPYGLMRACAETGGRYVTFSFHPLAVPDATYDYGRTNLFPPDLRSRAAILADLPSRPLALAILRAWDLVGNDQVALVAHRPPVCLLPVVPRALEKATGAGTTGAPWWGPGAEDRFRDQVGRYRSRLRGAIGHLETALANRTRDDDVSRRYRADADLFLFQLRTSLFRYGEMLGAWDAWTAEHGPDPDPDLVFRPVALVWAGPDERLNDVRPHRAEDALAILEARRDLVRRYRGTPWGELTLRNQVVTFRVERRGTSPTDTGDRSKRGSDSPERATPATGGSAGSTPATGR